MDPMGMLDMIPAGTPFFREKNKYPLDKIKSWTLANHQFSVETNFKPLWHLC